MSELVAIWVAGAAVLLLIALAAGVFLRFTRVGQTLELSVREVVTVLGVCIVFSCAAYTLLTIAV